MKLSLILIFFILSFFGCSKKQKILSHDFAHTYLIKSDFATLPDFKDENYDAVLTLFINNCKTKKARSLYGDLCEQAKYVSDAKKFLTHNFTPYIITTQDDVRDGLLTGYYEPLLHASLEKSSKYKYPLYETPNDLITIDLSSIYPNLKHYRLRGRLKGNKVVPYKTRAQSKKSDLNATVICYCDSKIDRFFLEIQGSGKVKLDDNRTLFIGYDNQNGYRYRAIGRYLVKIKALDAKEVSLQSIKAWLEANPDRVEEVLNYNKSMVFFKQREQGATGALGLELTPKRSIAIDRKYIPLGSMIYLHTKIENRDFNRVVFAQDTGGAIKNAVRADLFLGSGDEALQIAGKLKSQLNLWILLPKTKES